MTTPKPRPLRAAEREAFKDAKKRAHIRVQHACQVLQAVVGIHRKSGPAGAAVISIPIPPKPIVTAETAASFEAVPTKASIASSADQAWWDSFDTTECQTDNSDAVQSDHDNDFEPETLASSMECPADDELGPIALEQHFESLAEHATFEPLGNSSPNCRSDAAPATPQNRLKRPISIKSSESCSTDSMSNTTEPYVVNIVEPTTPKDGSLNRDTKIFVLSTDVLDSDTSLKALSQEETKFSIGEAQAKEVVERQDRALPPPRVIDDSNDATTHLLRTPFPNTDHKRKDENLERLYADAGCNGDTAYLLPEIVLELVASTRSYWRPLPQLLMQPTKDLPQIRYQQETVRSMRQPLFWQRDLVAMVHLWLDHCDTSVWTIHLEDLHLAALPSRGGRDTFCHGIHATLGREASSIRLIRLKLPGHALGSFSKHEDTEWYVLHIDWIAEVGADSFTLLAFQAAAVTQICSLEHGGERASTDQASRPSPVRLVLGEPGSMPAACGHGMDEWALEEFMTACARGDGLITMTPQMEGDS